MQEVYIPIEFDTTGGTFDVDVSVINRVVLLPATSSITLAANVVVNFTNTPAEGNYVVVSWRAGITTGANTVTINGINLGAVPISKSGTLEFVYIDGAWQSFYTPDFNATAIVSGNILREGTVDSSALKVVTASYFLVANGSGVPTFVAMSGDGTISTAGALTIANSAITNAKVAAAAAIARTKLASGTAATVLINDGSGVMSEEAQLAKSRGGFGADVSAANGFVKFGSGTLDISPVSYTLSLLVSFEAAGGTAPSVGDFKIKMSGAGTVTEIYAYAVKAIAGTDSGTITSKNNAGTSMTSGVVTFLASDPRGTAYTVTPSANNSFVDGDVLTFTTAKTTAGGLVQLSIKISRTS